MVAIDIPLLAAGITFFVVLWLLMFSPVSPLLKTILNVLTDPIAALVSTVVAGAAAYYVVVVLLHMSLFA